MPERSAAEIRASIEANRQDLAVSVNALKTEVDKLTDWRAHLERHKREVAIGAAVAGFVLAGGLAALGGSRRKRKKRRR